MNKRAEMKASVRKRIVKAAATRLRSDGLQGATIGKVLGDAGLTHGTFYAHFDSKEALLAEAFLSAVADSCERWIPGLSSLPANQSLALLVARNLGPAHLKHPETGCPFVAVGAEVWRENHEIRQSYEDGVLTVAKKIAEAVGDGFDVNRALAIHALCVGALTMARSVASEDVALQVMRSCRHFVLSSLPKPHAAAVA